MNIKKAIILMLLVIFVVVAYFTSTKELKAEVKFYERYGEESGLGPNINSLEKVEQKESDKLVYVFRNEHNANTVINIKSRTSIELVSKEKGMGVIYLKIKESEVQEHIKGNEIGKIIEIVTKEKFNDVVVTELK